MNLSTTLRAILTMIVMLLVSSSMNLEAQTNNGINYQAVIRNTDNSLVTNRTVIVRISILKDSINGQTVFSELHQTTTNANGLINVEIGKGFVVTGVFNSIEWHKGPFFIKSETSPNNDAVYSIVGTSKILNTPLALHSKSAEKLLMPNLAAGDMMYFDGSNWVRIPKGLPRQILTMTTSGVPAWRFLSDFNLSAPSATTLPPTNIAPTSALLHGIVNANGMNTTVVFEYGPSTSYGFEIAATPSQAGADTNLSVSVLLSDLSPGLSYHLRLKATNSFGTT